MAEGKIVGMILAGGRAERLGGRGKADLDLAGAPLIIRAIRRLQPQCASLVLNINDADAADWQLPVVRDQTAERLGPLGGVLAGLDWIAEHAPAAELMATIPVDGPFLPHDLIARLRDEREQAGAEIACAASNGRRHGVYALWPISLREDLRQAVMREDVRKVERFLARHTIAVSEWGTAPIDPFFNINTPDDLENARNLAAQFPAF